ncbi:Hypothetical protein SRAE_X000067300 [Strongyloides ratti]|uniref:Uncharacterized protein n=1 Tax=Strongyloides ratti TaxID=34506 RepID=A0A090LNL7_STRRB|nr:Hypothetical protein SRAE_X000067300 [Strongyloides ratti]CEF71346.1 Hypothetical protein SRAE_X000067300 [Strongyloides ratti]
MITTNVSAFWYSDDICNNMFYIDYCIFCYNTDDIMYFLSQVPYDDRCDYIRIGLQKNVTKKEILKQQDEFIEKQSEKAKKRYDEYKKEHEFQQKERRNRLDSEAKHLSEDAQNLYRNIYAVVDSNDVTLLQEYNLCHAILNEAKFKIVVEASSFIPARFFSETYDGNFHFHLVEDPENLL